MTQTGPCGVAIDQYSPSQYWGLAHPGMIHWRLSRTVHGDRRPDTITDVDVFGEGYAPRT
ncbi:MAG: hypothetical protein M0Z44_05720 [Gammaproteobacteria bacterium]|nr:hypothetical protein [Gammaproteobacteria bacterium]